MLHDVVDVVDVGAHELLAAEPEGDVSGVLHAHEEAALGVLAGLVELVLGDAVLELGELGEDGLEGGGGVSGVDGGVDLHGAGVAVVGGAAVGLVGEAALLPELQEEAAAHALAEDGAEHGIGVALGVLAGDAVEAEADVGLLRLAVLDVDAGGPLAEDDGVQVEGVAGGPVAHGALEPVDDLVVVDVAGDGDDGVGGDVLVVDEAEHGVAGEGADGVGGAADVAAEGLVGPHGLVDEEAGAGVGVIAGGGELLEDDAALLLELDGVEEGVADHVDDEVGGDVEVGASDLAPVGGDLAGGGGVHEAADAVNGL